MDINNFESKYVFTTKIELEDDDYLVLREPTALELKDFGEDEKKNFNLLTNLFPKCIIEHSFTKNNEEASNNEVADALIKSGSTYTQIINTWMESIPFKKKAEGK